MAALSVVLYPHIVMPERAFSQAWPRQLKSTSVATMPMLSSMIMDAPVAAEISAGVICTAFPTAIMLMVPPMNVQCSVRFSSRL